MGKLVNLIGSGVGLAAEAIAAKRERPRSKPDACNPPTQTFSSKGDANGPPPSYDDVVEVTDERPNELVQNDKAVPVDTERSHDKESAAVENTSESSSEDEDEAAWELDDAVESVEITGGDQSRYGIDVQPTIESFAAAVMARCPPPPKSTAPISLPVIVPQRRPGSSRRGFVRAYSPVLESNGIPEDAFIGFLKAFHDASKASPVLNVVYISAAIVGMVPEAAAQITGAIVQVAAGTAIALQKRQRTNTFLDLMNERLFKPRGLFAMVMTFQPNAQRPVTAAQMGPSELISKWTKADTQQWKKTLRASSGRTYGAMELPESAPLVYPAIDEVWTSSDNWSAGRMKGGAKFIANYYDKRGQIAYAQKHPSKMPLQAAESEQPFKHKLGDPNHPAFQGSWLTLFSGGYIPPKDQRFGRQNDPQRVRPKDRPVKHPYLPIGALKTLGQKRRAMKTGMLYLMVVNMPTDEELEMAAQRLQQAEEQAKGFLSF